MTQVVLLALIAAVPSALAGISAIVAAVFGWENHRKLTVLKIEIDGRISQLLTLTEKSSKEEGIKEEKNRAEGIKNNTKLEP